jgi:hypothetical protein
MRKFGHIRRAIVLLLLTAFLSTLCSFCYAERDEYAKFVFKAVHENSQNRFFETKLDAVSIPHLAESSEFNFTSHCSGGLKGVVISTFTFLPARKPYYHSITINAP